MEGRAGEGVGVGGVCQGKGEEDMACNSQKKGVKEMTGRSRIVWRSGRISNIVKTLEQGARQANKINSYFLKSGEKMVWEGGHQLAKLKTKLCERG